MIEVSAELWDALQAVAEAASTVTRVEDPEALLARDPDAFTAQAALVLALAALHDLAAGDLPDAHPAHRARSLIIEMSERHELEVHDGEPCEDNRVGLAAFISHSLGLRPWHMARVADELAVYNQAHDDRYGHHDGKDAT